MLVGEISYPSYQMWFVLSEDSHALPDGKLEFLILPVKMAKDYSHFIEKAEVDSFVLLSVYTDAFISIVISQVQQCWGNGHV